MSSPEDAELRKLARTVGNDWVDGPYYDAAEETLDVEWRTLIWPMIQHCDFRCIVEIGAGRGRNSEKLRPLAERLYLVDINLGNIEFLKVRFREAGNIVYVHNDGVWLDAVPEAEATLVYSYDSMVHFDSDVVRAYLREIRRVLRPGGRGFCHYSNYVGNPTGSYRDHPGWRNFMSRELFEHYAWKEGLTPVLSKLIRQIDGSHDDAITLFERR